MSILVVGRFGAPYGIRGWIKVKSFTDPIQNLLNYHPWKIRRLHSEEWEAFSIQSSQWLSHQIIVQISGCTAPEEVRRYTGIEIGIDSDQLPALSSGDFYWAQLIGLRVITIDGVDLGIIDDLLETGSNDVLIVKGTKTRLIPYLPKRVVQSIDLAHQIMIVDWDPE